MNFIGKIDHELLEKLNDFERTLLKLQAFPPYGYNHNIMRIANNFLYEIRKIKTQIIKEPKMTSVKIGNLLNEVYSTGVEGAMLRCFFNEDSKPENFQLIDLRL